MSTSTDNNINNNNVSRPQYQGQARQNEQTGSERGAFVEGATSRKPALFSRVSDAGASAYNVLFLRNETTVEQFRDNLGDVLSPWSSYMRNVQMYEEMTGKRYSVLHLFQTWYDLNDNEMLGGLIKRQAGRYQGFPEEFCSVVEGHGSVPMITWEPWGGFERDYSKPLLKQIIDELDSKHGKLYEYMKKWAEAARDHKKPLFLRLMHEMNSNWYPWTGFANGGGTKDGFGDKTVADGPEMYIAAWRRIYDLFKGAGGVNASNVTFVWCPDSKSDPYTGDKGNNWNDLPAYYPGQQYVDMVGLDGYMKFDGDNFDSIFGGTINALAKRHYIQGGSDPSKLIGAEKPFAICEWAAAPSQRKAEFIRSFYESMKRYNVALQSSFLVNKEADYRLISPIGGNEGDMFMTYFDSANAERQSVMDDGTVRGARIDSPAVNIDAIRAGRMDGTAARVVSRARAGDRKTPLILGYKTARFDVAKRDQYFRSGSLGPLGIPKLRLDDNRLTVDQTEIYSRLLDSIDSSVVNEGSMREYFNALLRINAAYDIKDIFGSAVIKDKTLLRAKIKEMRPEISRIEALIKSYKSGAKEAAKPAESSGPMDLLSLIGASQTKTEVLTLEDYLKYLELRITADTLEKACNDPASEVGLRTLDPVLDKAFKENGPAIDWKIVLEMAKPDDVEKGMKKMVLLKLLNRLINIPDNEYMYLSALEKLARLFTSHFGNPKSPNALNISDRELDGKYAALGLMRPYTVREQSGMVVIPKEVAAAIRIYDRLISLVNNEQYTKQIKLKDQRAIQGIKASSYAMQAAIMIDYYFKARSDKALLGRAERLLDIAESALNAKRESFRSPMQRLGVDVKTAFAGHDEDYFLRVRIQILKAQVQAETGGAGAIAGALSVFKQVLSDERIGGDLRDYVKQAIILILEKTSDPELLSVAQGIYAEFNLGKKAETGKDKKDLEGRLLISYPSK